MGYPVPANSPQVLIGGRTICVAAFDWQTPIGNMFRIGAYEKQADGSWNELGVVATYTNTGECLADMKLKGGGVKYMQWLKSTFNTLFAKLFAAPVVVTGEPTTDGEARGYIASAVLQMSLTVVNGVPAVA